MLARGDSAAFVITGGGVPDRPGRDGALEPLPAIRAGPVDSVHRHPRTEHDAAGGYGSAVAEMDLMPEDPVALPHSGLIPEQDVHYLRPARVHTSPITDGAA